MPRHGRLTGAQSGLEAVQAEDLYEAMDWLGEPKTRARGQGAGSVSGSPPIPGRTRSLPVASARAILV